MLVLIDESGDPGFKLAKGSTQHFVAAMVIFHELHRAEACSRAIRALRASLGISGEFKFNKTSERIKDSFFETVMPHPFEVRALVVDKAVIYSENLKRNDDRFYNFFVKSLLRSATSLQDARVKIDGSGDREFKNRLERYLKREMPAGAIRSVKFADSARDDLIQLADMVVGAIARSYRQGDRNKSDRWRNMIAAKVKDCWEFR